MAKTTTFERCMNLKPQKNKSSFFGASLSEPHTDVLAWDSVTRDISGDRPLSLSRRLFSSPVLFSGQTSSIASRHTEPRKTRIPMHNTRLRSRAYMYCAHTDARPAPPASKKYMTSKGRIGFLFSLRLDRLHLQENTQLA